MNKAIQAIRNAARSLREAAQREGILPQDPMWLWVISQEAALNTLADFAELQEAGIHGAVKDAKGLVDSQVEAIKKALVLSDQHNKRAEMALRHAEVDREKLVDSTVNELTAQVTAKLNGALVLRQQRYDRQQRLTTGGTMTAIVMALFFGGYALHAYLWRYETGGVERCMRQAVSDANGTQYCPLSAVKSDL
jgi:hypothetical protein